MEIVLSNAAIKFLEKKPSKEIEKIREKLSSLLQALETEGVVP
jgi:hypothetical protein